MIDPDYGRNLARFILTSELFVSTARISALCLWSQTWIFTTKPPRISQQYSPYFICRLLLWNYMWKNWMELLSQREESKDLLLSHQEFAEKLPGLWAFVIFIHRLFLMEFCAAKIHDYWTYCIRNWYCWNWSKGTLTTTY